MFALRTAFWTSRPAAARAFSTLLSTSTMRRPTVLGAAPAGLATPPTTVLGATDTIVPKVSASPVLQALQVRNGPRDTFDPSHRVRKRRSGFLVRLKTRTGRATLKRRKLKGRKSLSH
ncbi:ribosomal protein L34-domain-containing protein [Sphaerosporella brunnea]|uniref:Ribosomal protein L34-domain-containing protein n=1 Tax=Sphaerosporella brunnea TaxID=1250544 RepID=A0A5J5EWI0_9PEZI|nr:ribosomal protein L34-domain-containing protein [Sphaerosporella brunnea]